MLDTTWRRLTAAATVVAAATIALIGAAAMPAAAQTAGFDDVPQDAYYATPVADLHAQRVFDGTLCREGFCPRGPIDRKTMAVWTVRVLEGQDPPSITRSRFNDVDSASFHARFIERMAELGVTSGCGDGTGFCPDRTVTRAQMAVFLSRAFNLPDGLEAVGVFDDVPASAWYATDVARLAASGITAGCSATDYCPSRNTTRSQMATFLYRAIADDTESADRHDLEVDNPDIYLAERTDTKNITISVYYCGNDSNFNLSSQVAILNSIVSDFFMRESRGSSVITFVSGANGGRILDLDVDWNAQDSTLSHWLEDINNNGWKDPCREEARNRAKHQNVLVLADIRAGPGPAGMYVAGFAKRRLGGTPAIAATANNRTGFTGYYTAEDMFLGTVAHEIGHAYYAWQHTWDYPNETLEMRESLMSYVDYNQATGVISGAKRNLRSDAPPNVQAYIACIQRKERNWIEKTANAEECSVRLRAPGIPTISDVTPADSSLDISWNAPSDDGGSPVTGYDLWYRRSDSSTDVWSKTTSRSQRLELGGLTNGVTYYIAVRAKNDVGDSDWSRTIEGTPRSIAVPPPTRRVTLRIGDGALGDQGSDDVCRGIHCHWLHVEIEGFDTGSHTLVCAHNGVPSAGFSRGAYHNVEDLTDWPSTDDCLFGYPGSEVFVIVDPELRDGVWYGGTYSNTIVWPDCNRESEKCDRQSEGAPAEGILNDNPVLGDERGTYSWFKPPTDIDALGYGTSGFHFTLAIGNEDDTQMDNWAMWEFDAIAGEYEVQAFIPADWATAHVQYLIWADRNGDGIFGSNEYVDGPWLNQEAVRGWQAIGAYDLNGRVRIEIRDVRTRDDWNDVGPVYARLAVDAIRLVRADGPGETPGTPTGVAFRNSRAVWDPVAGADSYDVQECVSGGVSGCLIHQGVGCCRYALDPQSTSFRVRAVNSRGTGDWSSRAQISIPPQECRSVTNDDPRLYDEEAPYSWWEPPPEIARLGHGGDFHFTLAIGNSDDSEMDNWAAWEFESVEGSCEVQAWIPADWATAHVQYLIWADENGDGKFTRDEYVAGPWLDQQRVSGWQSLGTHDLRGRVRIEVRDTRTRDDHRDDGPVNTRLAVDAIRLR